MDLLIPCWCGKAEDATRQPEQIRAFSDTWQLGIHSYLAYEV